MFYLDLLEIGALTHNIGYMLFYVFPPQDFPHIAVHLSGLWMNRISAIMGFYQNMMSQLAHIRNTKSTLVVNYTISPFGENLHSLIVNCTLSSNKIRSLSLFFLTSTTKEDSTPFTSSFLYSSTCAMLPIDNLIRAYVTIFAIQG